MSASPVTTMPSSMPRMLAHVRRSCGAARIRYSPAAMATMEDVARVAGVSTTTVSHVLNGTRPVSEPRRPGSWRRSSRPATARTRSPGRWRAAGTQSLGLAISGLANPYFTELIAAVEQRGGGARHTLLLGDTHDDPEHELEIVRALVERRVDGLLLAPSAGRLDARCRTWPTQSLPVVLARPLRRRVAGPDRQRERRADRPARRPPRLVRALADRDGRRVAAAVDDARAPGRLRARPRAQRAGVRAGADRLRRIAARRRGRRPRGGCSASTRRPTALISGNNAMTIGVLEALQERGLAVPGRHRAGRRSTTSSGPSFFSPRLTVIAQPTGRAGRAGGLSCCSPAWTTRRSSRGRSASRRVRAPGLLRLLGSARCRPGRVVACRRSCPRSTSSRKPKNTSRRCARRPSAPSATR